MINMEQQLEYEELTRNNKPLLEEISADATDTDMQKHHSKVLNVFDDLIEESYKKAKKDIKKARKECEEICKLEKKTLEKQLKLVTKFSDVREKKKILSKLDNLESRKTEYFTNKLKQIYDLDNICSYNIKPSEIVKGISSDLYKQIGIKDDGIKRILNKYLTKKIAFHELKDGYSYWNGFKREIDPGVIGASTGIGAAAGFLGGMIGFVVSAKSLGMGTALLVVWGGSTAGAAVLGAAGAVGYYGVKSYFNSDVRREKKLLKEHREYTLYKLQHGER